MSSSSQPVSLEADAGDRPGHGAGLALRQSPAKEAPDVAPSPSDSTRRWQHVQFLSRSPGSRVFPSAVVHNSSLYVFGGHDGTVYRNDLLVFNFETRCWVTALEIVGEAPSPRDAHAAVVHDSWMCIFGGYDSKRYLNDFHRYDFDTSTWSTMPNSCGSPPSPRGGHSTGVYEDCMYVFGGCDGWNYFNDCYLFDLSRFEWSEVRVTGTAPGARSAPATVVHPGRACMYVFGGYDGSRSLNDLYCLNLGAARELPDE